MQAERVDLLQKEITRLQSQLDQQKIIEKDLLERAEKNRERADGLELMVHKGKDGERKEMIEMQIKVNQLEQEKSIKEEMHNK